MSAPGLTAREGVFVYRVLNDKQVNVSAPPTPGKQSSSCL